jgi:hypothetical protein
VNKQNTCETDPILLHFAYKQKNFLRETGSPYLKVPKRENFSLAFFTLSEPIWVYDLGTGKKILLFQMTPDFKGF